MALRPAFVIFIKLTLFIYTVRPCAVSCSTDYETLLNCSCPGLKLPEALIRVVCRHDDLILNSSCLVSAQQPFCVMYPSIMEEIADIDTICRASAVRVQDHSVITESVDWKLGHAVRPSPPFNISVKNTRDSYEITWDKKNPCDCLTYRVRISSHTNRHPSFPKPIYTLESTEPFVRLQQSRLQPGVCYRVDVQARLHPGFMHQGPWSDWSATTPCFSGAITHSPEAEGTNQYYWLITLPILMVLLSLAFSKQVFGLKRLQLMPYNPDPSEFFKKAWVMPVFSEQDFLKVNSVVDMKLNQWDQCSFLQTPLPPYDPGQSQSPSQSPSQSRGSSSVSIHTVTLNGSLGYPDEADCEAREGREAEGKLCENLDDLSLSSRNMGQELEEEGLSGDGYPHMDLDTIDSGFGECSSPPASGPSVEQLCELYQSNYVKQWTMDYCEGDSGRLTTQPA